MAVVISSKSYLQNFKKSCEVIVRMMTDGHSVLAQYKEASSDKVFLTNEVKGREDHCVRSTINSVMDEEPG